MDPGYFGMRKILTVYSNIRARSHSRRVPFLNNSVRPYHRFNVFTGAELGYFKSHTYVHLLHLLPRLARSHPINLIGALQLQPS